MGLVLVFTPLAPLGAGLLFVAGVSGATAAGMRIHDRIKHETFSWNTETMLDVIDLVSGAFVSGKIANSVLKLAQTSAKGAQMTLIVQGIETGTDAASVVLIGSQYMQQLEDLQNQLDNQEITQEEHDQQRQAILTQAAAVGLLLLVGYTAPKLSKRFGKSRQPKNEGGKIVKIRNYEHGQGANEVIRF